MKQKASLLAFLAFTSSIQLKAASVNLTAANGAGASSFASNLSWSNALAPSVDNDYFVTDARSLRTVADSGSATFGGNSLTLGNGSTAGIFIFKNQAAGANVTVNNLTLNNGEVQNGGTSTGAASVVTFSGSGISLFGTSSNRINSGATLRGSIITAPISGTGSLTMSGGGFVVLSGAGSYAGATTITGAGTRGQFSKVNTMSATSAVTAATGATLALNVGGTDEFSTTGTGAGTVAGILAGVGGQGSAVTLATGSSLGIDTTNAAGPVSFGGAFTSTNSPGLLKLGVGSLALTNGGSYAGNGAGGYPFIVREGELLLNGGTHTVTGEAVIGGTYNTAAGNAGLNAKLQIDSGSFVVSGYLSLGRGNGIGGVSSDLVVNNAASVTAANFSAGYNAASALNLPKGTATFNNSSTFTVTGNGAFNLAENAGSNMTLTLNNASQVTAAGTAVKYIGQAGSGALNINGTSTVNFGNAIAYIGYQAGVGTLNMSGGTFNNTGEVQVGGSNTNGTAPNGTGTFTISGGTATFGALSLARGNNNQNTVAGTGTISGTGIVNVGGDLTLGFAGNNNLGKLTVSGGALNVGTAGLRWFRVGTWDTARGQLDITGGAVNLLNGSPIKMNAEGGTGANVINQSGGTVTFYSDAGVTVGGAGHVDLQRSGAAASNNTYNLSGGTLHTPQVISSAVTGTRAFNFNGGTLKAAAASTNFFNLGSGNARANVRNNAAIIDSNGFAITMVSPLLHSNITDDSLVDGGLTKLSAGTLSLPTVNTYTGPTLVSGGTLALTTAGNINTSSAVTIDGSGAKLIQSSSTKLTAPVTLTQGSLDGTGSIAAVTVADSASNSLTAGNGGNGVLAVDALTFQGAAALNLRAEGLTMNRYLYSAALTTSAAGQITVNITNTSGVWLSGDYPVIQYGSFTGSIDHFVKGDIPGLNARQTATLVDTGDTIVLRIEGDSLTWTGGTTADWTTSSENNWNYPSDGTISSFADNNPVLFDDSASQYSVNIATAVSPSATIFNNNFEDYSLSGTFGISGSGSLVKNGDAKVTLTTPNTYTGSTAITAGVLQLGDGTTDGSISASSSITNNASLIFNLAGDSNVYGNLIGGSGTMLKEGAGSLTLSGANTFTGNLTLTAGTLNLNSASALGAAPGALVIDGGVINNTSGAAITLTTAKAQSWNSDVTFTGTSDLSMGTGTVTLGGAGLSRKVTVSAGTLGAGAISGLGYGLEKSGPGTLQLTPAGISSISDTLNIAEGVFNIGSQDFTCTGLTGTGTLGNGSTTTRWFFIDNATDFVFGGIVQDGGSGKLGFNKGGAGKLTLPTANYNDTTTVREGTLRLESGTSTNTGAVSSVGALAGANAVLELAGISMTSNTGAQIYNSSFLIGTAAGAAGSVKLTSGSLTTGKQLAVGGAVNNANQAYGAFSQTGGTTTIGGFLAMGLSGAAGGDRSVVNLSGGTFTLTTAPATIGAGANGLALFNLTDNGIYNHSSPAGQSVWIGENGAGVMNVSGNAAFTVAENGIELGRNNVATANGTLNLLGGTVTAKSITKPGALATGRLNFNGGTLVANGASTTFLNGLTSAHVHAGGGVINNGGNAITIGQALLAPEGNGVSAQGLIVEGGGFIDTPIVQITGDGTGATAVANIDSTGNLTGITITNPGTGYTTPPSFTLLKGGNGNTGVISGEATLVANTSGSIRLSGAGTTILGGANTYTGNTTVDSGTTFALADNGVLKFSPAANGVSNKVTGAGTAVFYGDFNIDLTGAAIANGNTWQLVDTSGKSFDSFLFTIPGFTQASDVWTKVDGDNTWSFSEATGTLSLAVTAPPAGFSSWVSGFGLDAADQDPTDDPDADGFSNLLEYALGGNPSSASSSIAPTGAPTAGGYVFTFRRSDQSEADTTQTVEFGDDLTVWGSIAIGSTSSGAVVISEDTPTDMDTVTVTIPTNGATKFFARLKVVK